MNIYTTSMIQPLIDRTEKKFLEWRTIPQQETNNYIQSLKQPSGIWFSEKLIYEKYIYENTWSIF